MTKTTVAFILPYFGKLPNYFQFYLESCKYNPDFDWILFTDDQTAYDYPINVHVNYTTFEEVKVLIHNKFDFAISLEHAHKLCDFKPAYGYIFEEYIQNYTFWGHVDADCIWGDLNKHISQELLAQYDKLFKLGHLTLYRNTTENNRMFMRPLHGIARYKEVYVSPRIFQFDEAVNINSINDIYAYYGIPVYEDKSRADVSPSFKTIRLDDYESPTVMMTESCRFQYFEWNSGTLTKIYHLGLFNRKEKECRYLHFHGDRFMRYTKNTLGNHFFVFRNGFHRYDDKSVLCVLTIRYLDYLFALFMDFPLLIRVEINKCKLKILKMVRR